MKFPSPISVQSIADRFQAKLIGDAGLQATGINEIHKVSAGDITFSDNPKYFKKALQSEATIILLNEPATCPPGKALLICDAPFKVYNQLVIEHRPFCPLTTMIDDSAVIHASAIIEPNVIIGPQVRIGKYTYIQANTYIGEHTIIGEHVKIQAGTVIGTDAFYFKRYPEQYTKWRSGGRVVIEDHVDIGAGCTINRGVSGDTIIGAGTKIDCQVHIAHGAVIGRNCLIAAQVGISGKSIIEDDVILYGQVGVAQNVRIGKGAKVAAQSGVSKDLEGGKTYFGAPAEELMSHHRKMAALRQLSRKKE